MVGFTAEIYYRWGWLVKKAILKIAECGGNFVWEFRGKGIPKYNLGTREGNRMRGQVCSQMKFGNKEAGRQETKYRCYRLQLHRR